MEWSPCWEANSHFSQKISHILWNLKVLTWACLWSLPQVQCIWSTPSHPIPIRTIIMHPFMPRSSGFPTKMYLFLISLMHATLPTHFTLLDLITLIIFSKAYKLQNSSLCSFFQPHGTSSFLGPNILLRTLFSNAISLHFMWETKNCMTWVMKHMKGSLFLCDKSAISHGVSP